MRNNRGALEGLPLYLIILIVVAAIVVAILVGWLSTLQHPGVQNMSYNLDGVDFQSLSQANYPTCTPASDSACFTSNPDGSCDFTVNSQVGTNPAAAALVITVTDKSGAQLSGVTVTLTGDGVSITASPSNSVATGTDTASGFGSGQAVFTGLTGSLPAEFSGGTIDISASYSSGGVQTSASSTITISAPSTVAC